MKIYQVHTDGGQYEDSYDFIVATYLNEQDAEAHKNYLLRKQNEASEQNNNCRRCPLFNAENEQEYRHVKTDVKLYCKMCEPSFDKEYGPSCKNKADEYANIYDERYSIKELEVLTSFTLDMKKCDMCGTSFRGSGDLCDSCYSYLMEFESEEKRREEYVEEMRRDTFGERW